MKIEQKHLDDHQLELVVEADQDAFEKAKYLAAKDMAKNKKIPGYRPGKAPYQLIVNHFGEGAIIDRALENFLDDIYPQIIDEIDEEPYGPGQVKEIQSLEPPVFVFEIPLQPEVELGNYWDLRIPFTPGEIDESETDQMLERMRTQQAEIESVDEPAEEGSLVDTSLSGYPVDADPEDQDQYILNEQPLPVMIKTEDQPTDKEWPFPGFSRQLLGVSAGDELELTYEFPDEEDVDEDYRGKEILFKVSVEGIRRRVLPDLDDEFVQSVSDHETVDEFLEQLRSDLEEQRAMEDEDQYVSQIFEELLEDSVIKFPPQMLENEIEGELRELESRLQAQGLDLETYLKIQDTDREQLKEDIRPGAEKRIQQGLIIGRISEDADLDISPEEITAEYQQILDDHFGENDQERQAFMSSNQSINLLNQISSQMVSRKTLEFLKALAKGEDTSSYLKTDDEVQDKQEDPDLETNESEENQPEDVESDPEVEPEPDQEN